MSPPRRRWRPPPSCASDLPDLRVRFVNVVDLYRMQPALGASALDSTERDFDNLFTTDRPVIFSFRLSLADPQARLPLKNHENLRARLQGAATSTPAGAGDLNQTDPLHALVMDVIDRVPGLAVPCCPPQGADEERMSSIWPAPDEHGTDPVHYRLGVALLNEGKLSVGGCSPSHLIPLNGERFPESTMCLRTD